MTDDTSLIEDQARARRAQEWLDNQIYKEAWEAMRMTALSKLEDLPLQDSAGREEIHHMLAVMRKVRAYIQKTVEKGKAASIELETRKRGIRRIFG
jgi:hypothetical protein